MEEYEIEVIFGQQNDADLVEYFENPLEALHSIGKNISNGYFIRTVDVTVHYVRKGEMGT